jgi:hypothetical protein
VLILEFVDIELRDGECLRVMAARRIVAGILHVHADVVRAFDLDTVHVKAERRVGRYADHAVGRLRCRRGPLDRYDLLRQEAPDLGKERKRAGIQRAHFDLAPALKQAYSAQWSQAIEALSGYPRVLQVMFYEAPFPAGDRIRESALAAGLTKPATRITL